MVGVIDTETDSAEWTFPAEAGAVRVARDVVRRQLGQWGLGAMSDVTELLVSELVTNSMRYASAPIGVRLTRSSTTSGTLLVEVSDPLPDPPRERTASSEDESGRGLQLVAIASRRWGTKRDDSAGLDGGRPGKTVWFELALPG